MQCIILNKNYPPKAGITGYSASILTEYLVKRGVKVTIVTTDADYGGIKRQSNIANIFQTRSIYQGKRKWLRFFASIYEGYKLTKLASSLKIEPWICMTDPPLLNLWVGLKAKKLKIPWMYWTMDLYPDAFFAAGLTKKNSYFYQILNYSIKKNQPSLLVALGRKQAEYLIREYSWEMPAVLLPCGISKINKNEDKPFWVKGNYEILFGYVGNVGEAHNANFLIEFIQQMDFKKNRFILSIYGAKANIVMERIRNIEGLIIVQSIPQSQLRFIDIHLATLLPKWDHICVPSKAVTSICQGGTLLYCGSASNDNWQILGECGWRIDPNYGIKNQIKTFFKNLNIYELNKKKKSSKILAARLNQIQLTAFSEIYDFIASTKVKSKVQ